MPSPERVVVGGQPEHRHRRVVVQVGVAAVGRPTDPVVAGVVAEPAVRRRLGGGAAARRDDPVDRRAVPAGRVDDQVGGEVAAVGAHADDPRHGGPTRRHQARNPRPAPDRHAGRARGHPRHGRLDHRTPGRHRVEPLVARPPPAGDVGGPLVQHVGAGGARGQHGREDLGQLVGHERPPPGQQEVQLAELGHAGPGPLRPGGLGALRRVRGVAVEHGDGVAVAGEQHGGGQPGEPGPEHEDVGHTGQGAGRGAHPPGRMLLTS